MPTASLAYVSFANGEDRPALGLGFVTAETYADGGAESVLGRALTEVRRGGQVRGKQPLAMR